MKISTERSSCSGSVVLDEYSQPCVLTAAHCFEGIKSSDEIKTEFVNGEIHYGTKVFTPPDYEYHGPSGDYAYVTLPTYEGEVMTKCQFDQAAREGEVVITTGYGKLYSDNTPNTEANCKGEFGRQYNGTLTVKKVSSDYYKSSRYKPGDYVVCAGDSGSPVYHTYHDDKGSHKCILGVVSTSYYRPGLGHEQAGFSDVAHLKLDANEANWEQVWESFAIKDSHLQIPFSVIIFLSKLLF